MYVGGSEARRARALCKNSNIKGESFFCACCAGWRCRLPPTTSAVWWVYARVRHPKAAFATASSDVPRRVSCFGPEPAAVLPARPPADQQGSLGRQEHSRPCDAAWAALLPALRIGASACDT